MMMKRLRLLLLMLLPLMSSSVVLADEEGSGKIIISHKGGTSEFSLDDLPRIEFDDEGFSVSCRIGSSSLSKVSYAAGTSITFDVPLIVHGDANGDFVVDVADVATIITEMTKVVPDAIADVNGDGVVDVADVATIIDIMADNARVVGIAPEDMESP